MIKSTQITVSKVIRFNSFCKIQSYLRSALLTQEECCLSCILKHARGNGAYNCFKIFTKNQSIKIKTDYYQLDAQRFLRDSWRLNAGYTDTVVLNGVSGIDELKRTEWSIKFEQLVRSKNPLVYEPFFVAMKNRLVMGSFRYGRLNATGKANFDRMARIKSEIELFNKDHSIERLVDIANMCLLEFEEGTHDKSKLVAITRRSMRVFAESVLCGIMLAFLSHRE